VIGLGHSLGFKVTAEGVETQDVADWLHEAGCDRAQGYLWMRPAPWTEVADALTASDHKADLAAASAAGAEKRTGR
jgi:EAL domain-containing protein (putative c-di-GMP-specific phosphodiesterase class I)